MASDSMLGGLASGIYSLAVGDNPGIRRTTRLGAQGTLQGYAETLGLRELLQNAAQNFTIGQGGQSLEQLLFGSEGTPLASQTGTLYVGNDKSVPLSYQTFTPGSSGYLSMLGDTAGQLGSLAASTGRNSIAQQLGLLSDYLPAMQAVSDQQNPELAALRKQIGTSALTGLKAGSQMTPDETYKLTNSVRSDWASRGFADSSPAQLAEALKLYTGGQDLYNTRLNNALNAANTLKSTTPDYLSTLLGLEGNDLGNANNLLTNQQKYAYQSLGFDPYAAQSLNSTGLASLLAGREAQTEAWGSVGSSVGKIISAIFGGAGGGMGGAMGGGMGGGWT